MSSCMCVHKPLKYERTHEIWKRQIQTSSQELKASSLLAHTIGNECPYIVTLTCADVDEGPVRDPLLYDSAAFPPSLSLGHAEVYTRRTQTFLGRSDFKLGGAQTSQRLRENHSKSFCCIRALSCTEAPQISFSV